VFNTAAKLEFALAAAALVFALGVQVAVDEPAGFLILLGISVAAVLAGLALTGSGLTDRATRYGLDAPPVEMVSVDRSLISPPSRWPFAAAVAALVLAVGMAVGHAVVYAGIVCSAIAAAGWLAQSWREDPSYTPREGAKISDRLIAPVALPLLSLALVFVIVVSVSRILLAVPKDVAVAVSGALTVVVVAAFFFLSTRPRIARNGLIFLSGFATVAVVTAGSVSAASGYRTFERTAPPPAGTVVRAEGTKYDAKQLTVRAGDVSRITFENLDRGIYHNIAVYTQAAGGQPIWNGEPVAGPKTIIYQHVFDRVGTYSFRCDFHPTAMIGTFVVAGQ
jgi:plastocyanin